MQEWIFEIPDGFRIIRREAEPDLFRARDMLLSRRKRRITSAVRSGEVTRVIWHVVECPVCRRQVPAYSRRAGTVHCVSRDAIREWSDPQYSLFEKKESRLVFNAVCDPGDIFVCPFCKQASHPCGGTSRIRIASGKKKLTVFCSPADTGSLKAFAKREKMKIVGNSDPVTEELTFNLRNGHTSIRIRGGKGETVIARDVTMTGNNWSDTAIYKLIETNALVKRKLYQAFCRFYADDVPFPSKEISPKNAVAMTRFKSFPRAFYDAIPYSVSDNSIDRSFSAALGKIHKPADLPAILKKSTLPNAKSLKRILFSSPGFFIYIPELELMWMILQDVNYMPRFLASANAYVVLSFLHIYPFTWPFFRDYREKRGAGSLFSHMNGNWREFSHYSIFYCLMNPFVQRNAQQTWGHTRSLDHMFSLPMQPGPMAIKNCTINGFSFEWLRTKYEFIRAGESLHNCLQQWSPFMDPVVRVRDGSETVAAIQVRDHSIIQARAAYNAPISDDIRLNSAYQQWKEKYSLSEDPCNDDYDGYAQEDEQ